MLYVLFLVLGVAAGLRAVMPLAAVSIGAALGCQPEERSNSWRATLYEQRIRIRRLIDDSPSLKSRPGETLDGSYVIGRYEAIKETKLPESAFPETCPYTVDQILDPDFLPGGE